MKSTAEKIKILVSFFSIVCLAGFAAGGVSTDESIAIVQSAASEKPKEAFKIATFNVRCSTLGDLGEKAWYRRMPASR